MTAFARLAILDDSGLGPESMNSPNLNDRLGHT